MAAIFQPRIAKKDQQGTLSQGSSNQPAVTINFYGGILIKVLVVRQQDYYCYYSRSILRSKIEQK